MSRLFIALKIPQDIREKIFNLPQKIVYDYGDYRWEPADKIHLTLKFIGDVDEELIEPICDSIGFISDYSAFKCNLTRFGFFYRLKDAKILWLGLSIDESIKDLVKKLNDKLAEFGIAAENREFKPHLTMLRIKNKTDKNFIDSFLKFKFEPEKFISKKVSLMQSKLNPSGSVYSDVKIFNLK